MDDIEFEFTVSRNQVEEIVYAEFTGFYERRLYVEGKGQDLTVKQALQRAIHKWLRSSSVMWNRCDDFTVSDLIAYIDISKELRDFIVEEGITQIDIKEVGVHNVSLVWDYDDNLPDDLSAPD